MFDKVLNTFVVKADSEQNILLTNSIGICNLYLKGFKENFYEFSLF